MTATRCSRINRSAIVARPARRYLEQAIERAVGGRHVRERRQRRQLGDHDLADLGERADVGLAVRAAGLQRGDGRELETTVGQIRIVS